jgi:hypothetical protein
MLKKYLMVGAVALLAAGTAKPAAAQDPALVNLNSPYTRLHRAGTSLARPMDMRPWDALVVRRNEMVKPELFQVGAYGEWLERFDDDRVAYGGQLIYTNQRNKQFAFELWGGAENLSVDFDGGDDDDFLDWRVGGKIVLWDGTFSGDGPATTTLSLVKEYSDAEDLGHAFSVGLALDQAITRNIYLTANVGYANFDSDFGDDFDDDGITAGFGAVYSFNPKLSLSLEYIVNTDFTFQDDWAGGIQYRFTDNIVGRAWGGKHGRFGFGANYQFR